MSSLVAPDFRVLFEGAPGLYLVLRPESGFIVLGASDAYLKATLIDRAAAIGKGLFEIFPDNPDDTGATGTRNLRASLERVVATRAADAMAVQRYDIRLPAEEGGGFVERFWSPLNSPVFAADGSLAYIIHRVEDVTEFVRLTRLGEAQAERSADLERRNQAMQQDILRRSEELDAANNRLRDANASLAGLDQAKTVFFNNISHEFRTPLTLMLGPAEEALADAEQPLVPTQRERLAIIHRNGLRLMRLVNALLDFARLEAGRMQARYLATDLASATTELASMFDSAMTRAGISLTIDCPPLSAQVWVDREMWERIVLNLVSNAFKFTISGGITIRLRESGTQVRLDVIDTGTGIPTEELPRLFERFHRVQGAQGRSIEGSGIGLSMVAELVRMHGGTVAVESRLGAGSTFTVAVPLGKDHLPVDAVVEDPGIAADRGQHRRDAAVAEFGSRVVAAVARTEDGLPGAAGRILLAEDNPDLRSFTTAILARHYQVEAVTDGEEALAAIARQAPDLVLSDVMMPRLDGLGLLRRLRADPSTRTIPVILLSARAGEEATVAGLDASAEDYLAKPFSSRELLARVRTHLAMARVRREWADGMRQANQELEAFSYSVSHDLRAPLRAIDGFAKALADSHAERLDSNGRHYLERIRAGSLRMGQLIEDLLALSRISRVQLRREPVALDQLAKRVVADLVERHPGRRVEMVIAPAAPAVGDPRLLTVVLENLLGNAWKFTARNDPAHVAFEHERVAGGDVFRVRDDGAGFDMAYAGKLFAPFQRLHREADFPGIGIGLATVQRIITRHGGKIWAESAPGAGAMFSFTLGDGS